MATFWGVVFFLGGEPGVLESPQLGSAGRVQLKLDWKLPEPLIQKQPRGDS